MCQKLSAPHFCSPGSGALISAQTPYKFFCFSELCRSTGFSFLSLARSICRRADSGRGGIRSQQINVTTENNTLFVLKKSNRTQGNATLFCTGRDIEDREIELAFSKEEFTWKMTADSAENPNMLLPDEMNLLIEMMIAEKYFKGSNAEFLERYNAFSGKNLSARILKRMMNKWKYALNDNHIYFKSYKENNIRKVEVKYDCENDNSDSEYVRYDKYDENIAV